MLKKLSALGQKGDGHESEREEEQVQEEPPASALHRRRALVPPKLITDGYESATEDIEQTAAEPNQSSTHL